MKPYVIRLVENDDLKESIDQFCRNQHIDAGCILSGVGCVKAFNIRLADGVSEKKGIAHYEIVSLMGTVGTSSHLHISLADEEGKVIGGHLKKGCIINTTCELVILALDEYHFSREFDSNTGYDELVIK